MRVKLQKYTRRQSKRQNSTRIGIVASLTVIAALGVFLIAYKDFSILKRQALYPEYGARLLGDPTFDTLPGVREQSDVQAPRAPQTQDELVLDYETTVCRIVKSDNNSFAYGNSRGSVKNVFRAVIEVLEGGCEGKLFVDVGANVGKADMLATEIPSICGKVPQFRAFFFEPNPNNVKQLDDQVAGDSRLTAVHSAVGANLGNMTMYGRNDVGFESATLAKITKGSPFSNVVDQILSTVNVITLDNFNFGAEGAGKRAHVDFLKVDVEGYEESVFRGASKLLESGSIPILMYECHGHFNEDQWLNSKRVQFFQDLNYDQWIVHGWELSRLEKPYYNFSAKWAPVDKEDNCVSIDRRWPLYRMFLEKLHVKGGSMTPLAIFDLQEKYGVDRVRECKC